MSEIEKAANASSPVIAMRLTAEAKATLEARAADARMTAGEFAKLVVLKALGEPAPIRDRRQVPPIDADAIRAALGAINRVGNNMNQLTVLVRRNSLYAAPTAEMATSLKLIQEDWAKAIDALQTAAGVKVKP
jgi:hypothetical protein